MCYKCNGSGLLPFIKNGRTIPNVKLFCGCHPIYGVDAHYGTSIATEGKRPPTRGTIPRGRLHLYQDDFDFPVSYSVYRSLCQEHGWTDPGPDRPQEPETPQEQVIIHRHSNMSKQEYDLLQQFALRTKYLEDKVAELQARRKPKGKY